MTIETLNRDYIESQIGYRPFTTFWEDFSIAERFGINAIKDTYKRAKEGWKNDYKYFTELVLILNWKIRHYYEKNESLARVYQDLWDDADVYAVENFADEALNYYYRTTD